MLVAAGRYYENLVFRGRRIVVASEFLFSGQLRDIRRTILDGSRPTHPDTASVVRFINAEDSTAVLWGFTITGGTGTKWRDPHSPRTYREGGGVLAQNASPTIAWNLITGNRATDLSGVSSAGGGGLRFDSGRPHLHHNVITDNRARYGAGIVLNYAAARLHHNIVAHNTGGEDFSGGGLWLNQAGTATAPTIIEHNTIVGNASAGSGGGIMFYLAPLTVVLRHNLIWNNYAPTAPQLNSLLGLTLRDAYNDVQGLTLPGPGHLRVAPGVADSLALLAAGSPCTDAGDPAPRYSDPATGTLPGVAVPPATGTARADIGAYGGPGAARLPTFGGGYLGGPLTQRIGQRQPVGTVVTYEFPVLNLGTRPFQLDSVRVAGGPGSAVTVLNPGQLPLAPLGADTLRLRWTVRPGAFADTLLLYHADSTQPNPRRVRVFGTSILGLPVETAARLALYPNPVGASGTTLHVTLGAPMATSQLLLTDVLGRVVWQQAVGWLAAGTHQLPLVLPELVAGVYQLRMASAGSPWPYRSTVRLVVP